MRILFAWGTRTPALPLLIGLLYPSELIRQKSWCGWLDSNQRPSGSENYDAGYNSMIYSDFLLVLHCSATPITGNIKQCVNDKNRPPAAEITAGGQLVVKKWSMRARYGAAFCLTVSPFHSGSRHNPLLSEFTGINAIYQLPIGHSFAQGNSDKKVIYTWLLADEFRC